MLCPNCNREISDDSLFCPGCGHRIIQTAEITTPEKTKKKLNVKIIAIGAVILVIIVCGGILAYVSSTPEAKYNKAEKAFDAGNYKSAIKYYTAAGDYEDAADKLAVAELANHYITGLNLLDAGNYKEAKMELEASLDYENTTEQIRECDYNIALSFMAEGDYLNAAASFQAAGDYADANEQIIKMGQQLVKEASYADAVTVFSCAKSGSGDTYAHYANGQIALDNKKYSDAASYFNQAGDILDARDLYKDAQYQYAKSELDSEKYSSALIAFEKISDYKDSSNLINACSLMFAKEIMDAGKLNAAKTALEKLPSDFSYNNVSVASLLEKLNANSDWLAYCGKWSNTSGEATSNCKARNYSYDGGTWSSTFDAGDYTMEIQCVLNSDGSVSVTGTGTIFVFKNWSTIQIGLDYDRSYSISFVKKLYASDLGQSISVDDYTTITLEDNQITLRYNYNDNNASTTFVYNYETNVTYGKRIATY